MAIGAFGSFDLSSILRRYDEALCSFISGSILAQRSSRSTLDRVQICGRLLLP